MVAVARSALTLQVAAGYIPNQKTLRPFSLSRLLPRRVSTPPGAGVSGERVEIQGVPTARR
ncbi:hypothetical protein D3C86_1960200 [compost metagenome]